MIQVGPAILASQVAVIDLDMKPLSKVAQHYALDQAILRCTLAADGDD